MRRALLLILIFVPLWLAAQDMPFETRTKTRFSTSGMIGIEQVDSLKFYRARLIQEFKVWKIGIGLDLDFLFDEDFGLRVSDWDHLENLLDKFYYVKYAGRRDPYYAHLGGFPDMTIGNGLIMKKYSNMDLYPALRNAGLMIGANPNIATSPSFEIFSSNLKRNEIMSLSARARPMPDSTIRVLDEMIVGMSLVVDRNQNANLKYVVPDSLHSLIPQKRDSAMVMGIAYSLPFYRTKNYTVGQYAEFAHIAGLGSGAILPGIYIDFDFIKVNLEYRVYGSKFTPAFFDEDYETERGYVLIDSLSNVRFRTKEDFVKTLKPAKGINGTVQGNYKDRIKASVTWQNIIGRDFQNSKSLWLRLWVDTQYKYLENFSISYSRTNVQRLSIARINEANAKIGTSLTFRLSKRWYLIGKYSESYKDRNNDGSISWLKEAKRSGGLGVKYLH